MKENRFTGIDVIENFQGFQEFYEKKKVLVDILDKTKKWYPNQYLVLKSNGSESQLAKISADGKFIVGINQNLEFFGIKARNKEQAFLMDMLNDPKLQVITCTGRAGSGKSLLISAYLLEMVSEGKIDKLILTKPMEVVGGTSARFIGIMPGDEKEKFNPFLLSFKYLFDKLSNNSGAAYFESLVKKNLIEFIPTELMRGISVGGNTCIYLDEAQNIAGKPNLHMLGTRLADSARLFISGDTKQIDVTIKSFKPGILDLIDSEEFKNSPITSHISLNKIERGPVAQLFADIFEKE